MDLEHPHVKHLISQWEYVIWEVIKDYRKLRKKKVNSFKTYWLKVSDDWYEWAKTHLDPDIHLLAERLSCLLRFREPTIEKMRWEINQLTLSSNIIIGNFFNVYEFRGSRCKPRTTNVAISYVGMKGPSVKKEEPIYGGTCIPLKAMWRIERKK